MALVDYSDSEEEYCEERSVDSPAKKRKISHDTSNELPPLPTSFLDQYSSTVRTSTQDDPSLHAGRKRVTPHVEGNWPTHVYLEWHPNSAESKVLSELVSSAQSDASGSNQASPSNTSKRQAPNIKSLLENDLGVQLPLHVSLSRPLALRTEQKQKFLDRLKQTVINSNIKAFTIKPKDLAWHPNEDETRWFLVLRLQLSSGAELSRLLETCNSVASSFRQPLLYAGSESESLDAMSLDQHFHISIAWSLQPPTSRETKVEGDEASCSSAIPYEQLGRLTSVPISFKEVKVRIGQDVHNIPLKARRQSE